MNKVKLNNLLTLGSLLLFMICGFTWLRDYSRVVHYRIACAAPTYSIPTQSKTNVCYCFNATSKLVRESSPYYGDLIYQGVELGTGHSSFYAVLSPNRKLNASDVNGQSIVYYWQGKATYVKVNGQELVTEDNPEKIASPDWQLFTASFVLSTISIIKIMRRKKGSVGTTA